MKINQKKTKLMSFNRSKTNDCQPEFQIDGVEIEVVKQMKLLGVIITDNLKWYENTTYITKKPFSRLWVLRRLKNMGASKATLVDVYNKQIRSVFEYASVVWNAGLTIDNKIERVQKSAYSMLYCSNYVMLK